VIQIVYLYHYFLNQLVSEATTPVQERTQQSLFDDFLQDERGVRNSNLDKKGNRIFLLFFLFFLLFWKIRKVTYFLLFLLKEQRAGVMCKLYRRSRQIPNAINNCIKCKMRLHTLKLVKIYSNWSQKTQNSLFYK